jgi:alpha-tubulin suppressor-like RCC1 family protein
MRRAWLSLVVALVACARGGDALEPDAGAAPDATMADAAPPDTGEPDAGPTGPCAPSDWCDGRDNDCDGEMDEEGAESACHLLHAEPLCVDGACAVGSCESGWADCDVDAASGCEVDLRDTGRHCGSCDVACGAGTACVAGACAPDPIAGLAAHSGVSCARRQSGALFCWGGTQLEDGTLFGLVSTRPAPVPYFDDAVDLDASDHICVVRGSGEVWCWGFNGYGQLGRGSVVGDHGIPGGSARTPGPALGLADAEEVVTGQAHTCARRRDGSVSCWGYAEYGQVGYGGTGGALPVVTIPVDVVDLPDATSLAAGAYHSCATRSGGSVVCWGRNTAGQLTGVDGTSVDQRRPVAVDGVSGAVQVAARGWLFNQQACARTSAGRVVCWGGLGSDYTSYPPTEIAGLEGVVDISAGTFHWCVVGDDGVARCWGGNSEGQLGDGTYDARAAPTPVIGLTGVVEVAAGASHTCARTLGGDVQCWGVNTSGELGDGTVISRPRPALVSGWPAP